MVPASGSPRRVLMTADAVGGVWDYALELAGGLARRGVRVTLAAMGPAPSPAQRARAIAIPGLGLHLGEFKLEWMERPEDDLAAAGEWLLDLAERVAPDLVHLNGYAHAALPWERPVVAVAHSCVLSWWQAVHGCPAPADWRPYADRVAAGLAAADRVVAPTRAMLDALETHYGPVPHGRVIWNGRDGGTWHPRPDREPTVISVGRIWDEAKNIRALDRVAAELDWPVVVAGSRRHPDGRSPGGGAMPANLRLLGHLRPDELADWYGRAAVFALPARYEPFGLSILEAALSGCALVLGDVPSLRELWTGAAVFVPPDDPAALARELRRMAADPPRLRALATAARQRARSYGTERMVARYLDVYADLLDAPRSIPLHRESAAVPLER
ncbi:glycosyltransferase family 4 protein [Skermanella sp. TT6]|uniref:Glycosyltransferase family 4 protein n=1 Tax=Skermanella cutis TaxID=2775420 RepID=A0ABX7B9K7_9PROT|nr:glycosyltransferase family 4 protein [Skermanella sp. TT6]QQP91060.1 glycosyltransferase family 4 protein [Skermanella sp. TT6]